ncbi:LLM class flavin-dependent oxidoreductase [Cryobacterium tepidiphilum]|uniref:LLM class flavin-dependent oxidoreductase n=1 Tax=Cryobacterium tepidiphilum TaxID=2486026 RepID=A0A3M8LAJ2_9MICO|nr:LLM class flavin-dependent oxidoreductase [Cryobacterium tepidiphilum]RNE62466.1 LLM class flavin-dependent oxidoreductase [Cryobacterium tepidiphilum]
MTSELALSVLDLIPVRSNQSSADAVAASVALARRADELGYRRYWVAEHHNMVSVASTNPPVLIGIIAANTRDIRVGSGGVMLPNHSPLVVAEQFAILEAAFPGRIDLGLGRAPGSDPVITSFLRSSGAVSDVDAFPNNVQDIAALLDPDGAALRLTSGQEYGLRATPRARSAAALWLLGSSDYSARLAARLGMPYVFAHHFAGENAERIIGLYRSGFVPAQPGDAPRTFLTLNVSVADTADEALARALPQLQSMARLRSGAPMLPLATVEEAQASTMTPQQEQLMQGMREKWVIGTPTDAAARIRELAADFGVDEVMVVPGASAHATDPATSSPARERALELLAGELLGQSARS